MKVSIKTGFWTVKEYLFSIQEKGLLLRSNDTEWNIPFSDLVRFTLTGMSDNPERFTLETKKESYEGRFLEKGAGKKLVEQLSKQNDQSIEIVLMTKQHNDE